MPRPDAVSHYHISYAIPASVERVSHRGTQLVLTNPTTVLNLALIGLAAVLLLYYVLTANTVAANQYHTQALSQQVQALSETHMTLTQEQARLGDSSMLATFASQYGMVVANEASYVFDGGKVAYQR